MLASTECTCTHTHTHTHTQQSLYVSVYRVFLYRKIRELCTGINLPEIVPPPNDVMVCPRTNICVLIIIHIFSRTAVYVSSYEYVSSYYYICVLVLLYVCPHIVSHPYLAVCH
jgi:hypothetical protein